MIATKIGKLKDFSFNFPWYIKLNNKMKQQQQQMEK